MLTKYAVTFVNGRPPRKPRKETIVNRKVFYAPMVGINLVAEEISCSILSANKF